MKLSPVVLFVYNRPWHTQKTIESLQKNILADHSDLIIFSDGPRSQTDDKDVQTVRDYLKNINGFKSVTLFRQKANKGLADSIINGVTEVVNKHNRIIVLEDDIVTSPCFLRYMNDALTYYQDTPQVMHISGYTPPINFDKLPQTFFIRPTSCWGWGTWKSSWSDFEKNPEKLLRKFTKESKSRFNINNSYDYFSHITANQKGKINTWAIFWYASVFFSDGLSLHPAQSLVSNIGHDSSGVHCRHNHQFNSPIRKQLVTSFTKLVKENHIASKELEAFYKSLNHPFYKRIFQQIKCLLRKG